MKLSSHKKFQYLLAVDYCISCMLLIIYVVRRTTNTNKNIANQLNIHFNNLESHSTLFFYKSVLGDVASVPKA